MKTLKTELLRHGFQRSKPTVAKDNTKTKRKRKEHLTDRDLRELMGTNRPTYARKKGGAFRQR